MLGIMIIRHAHHVFDEMLERTFIHLFGQLSLSRKMRSIC